MFIPNHQSWAQCWICESTTYPSIKYGLADWTSYVVTMILGIRWTLWANLLLKRHAKTSWYDTCTLALGTMLRVGLKQVRNHWGHIFPGALRWTNRWIWHKCFKIVDESHTKSPLGDLASQCSLPGNTFYFSDKQETAGLDQRQYVFFSENCLQRTKSNNQRVLLAGSTPIANVDS